MSFFEIKTTTYNPNSMDFKQLNSLAKCGKKIIESAHKLIEEDPDKIGKTGISLLYYRILVELTEISKCISMANNPFLSFPDFSSKSPKSPEVIALFNERGKMYSIDELTNSPITKELAKVDTSSVEMLFERFLEWYEISNTPSLEIYRYVLKNFPKEIFRNIACIGDGPYCHLGRKLALAGYHVRVIDPVSLKRFQDLGEDNKSSGTLQIENREFSLKSKYDIAWANLIVGAKIPSLSGVLLECPKPVAFTISSNPAPTIINGTRITSAGQLHKTISAFPHVRSIQIGEIAKPGMPIMPFCIYTHDGYQRKPNKESDHGDR